MRNALWKWHLTLESLNLRFYYTYTPFLAELNYRSEVKTKNKFTPAITERTNSNPYVTLEILRSILVTRNVACFMYTRVYVHYIKGKYNYVCPLIQFNIAVSFSFIRLIYLCRNIFFLTSVLVKEIFKGYLKRSSAKSINLFKPCWTIQSSSMYGLWWDTDIVNSV